MNKTDPEYKYVGNCPVCSTKLQPQRANVVSSSSESSQIYAECGKCKSSTCIYILRSSMGFITTVSMLTDLTKEDVLRFKDTEPISEDDVLAIHKYLEEQ